MIQPCSGQATLRPKTIPCDKGPPLCGQRSSSAKHSPSALRNTAISPPVRRRTRAPSSGISSGRQTLIQRAMRTGSRGFINASAITPAPPVFRTRALPARRALLPRIGLALDCVLQPCPERLAVVGVLDDPLLDVIE